jgi:hypothetical protein
MRFAIRLALRKWKTLLLVRVKGLFKREMLEPDQKHLRGFISIPRQFEMTPAFG